MTSIKVGFIPGWRLEASLQYRERPFSPLNLGNSVSVLRYRRIDEPSRRLERGKRSDAQASEIVTARNRCVCLSPHALSKTLIADIYVVINRVAATSILLAQVDGVAG
jgi:hypothetical protein